jgi:hypothetical protein
MKNCSMRILLLLGHQVDHPQSVCVCVCVCVCMLGFLAVSKREQE